MFINNTIILYVETHTEQRLEYCCGRPNDVVFMRIAEVFLIPITKDTKKDNLGFLVSKIDKIEMHIQVHTSCWKNAETNSYVHMI